MTVVAVCGGCNKRYQVREDLAGNQLKCPGCGGWISVAAVGGSADSAPEATLAQSSGGPPPRTVTPIAAPGGVGPPPAPPALPTFGMSPPPRASCQGYAAVLPPRAAKVLYEYPPPLGLADQWPLDDRRLAELQQTERYRRQIRQAAMVCRLMLWLCTVGFVVTLLVFVFVSLTASRSAGASLAVPITIALAICAGEGVIYFLGFWFGMLCRAWAPLTIGILSVLQLLGIAAGAIVNLAAPRTGAVSPGPYAYVFGIALVAAFPLICGGLNFMAVRAIPKFLAQPAWCQEALVACKL